MSANLRNRINNLARKLSNKRREENNAFKEFHRVQQNAASPLNRLKHLVAVAQNNEERAKHRANLNKAQANYNKRVENAARILRVHGRNLAQLERIRNDLVRQAALAGVNYTKLFRTKPL